MRLCFIGKTIKKCHLENRASNTDQNKDQGGLWIHIWLFKLLTKDVVNVFYGIKILKHGSILEDLETGVFGTV
jgi:hypothetical protein